MGMNCCDFCPPTVMEWCLDAAGDIETYWDVIRGMGVDGLAPCDHPNEDRYYDAVIVWKANMERYYARNMVVE